MAKRARKTYTAQKRSEILVAAQRENLTANDVKKKFGVTPVTYYSWRKKEGLVGRRGRRPSLLTQVGGGGNIAVQVRAGVQAKVRAVMPSIVREEVTNYLNALFAGSRRPGRPRKLL
jgi:transposase-like protein